MKLKEIFVEDLRFKWWFQLFWGFYEIIESLGSCSKFGNLEFYKSSGQNVILESFRVCLVGGVKKWEDIKDLVFPYVCLVGGVERWKGRKLSCLAEEKKERMENIVYINWLLCPCYIIYKK